MDTTQCPQPGRKPGPLSPATSALTMTPLYTVLPMCRSNRHKMHENNAYTLPIDLVQQF